jgi:predicted ATPase
VPLQSLTVQRYRAFKERTKIELRPITLLFGYNSAGKSALLRLLPLLRDSLADGRAPLYLGSEAIRGASLSDLLSRLHPTPVLGIELASQDVTASYEIRYLPDQRRQVLERITRYEGGIERALHWTTTGSRYELSEQNKPVGELDVEIKGLSIKGDESLLGRPVWDVPGAKDLASVHWVDALRHRVRRRTSFGPRPSESMAADGSDAPAVFAHAMLDESPLYDTVRAFYRENLGHEISVVQRGDDFQIVMAPVSAPLVEVDLIDTGEGLGQVLPVAVALAQATHSDESSLIAVEQPELHLHPRLHEQLAHWICRLVSRANGPRVIVETHSENILLTILLSLIEGDIEVDDLIVYWVHQLENGQSIAERITFDDLAQPQGLWPPDVFQEDAALAARLNRKRLERLGR